MTIYNHYCLDTCLLFTKIAQCNSLSEASKKLHLNITTISRKMIDLEEAFKIKLFIRRGNSISLTADGKNLFFNILPSLSLVTKNIDDFKIQTSLIKGKVTIVIPSALSIFIINESLHTFLNSHSHLRINIIPHFVDYNDIPLNYDLAITTCKPTKNYLIYQRICVLEYSMYATNDYIKNHLSTINNIHDIPKKQIINFINDYATHSHKKITTDDEFNYCQITIQHIMHLVLLLKTDMYVGILPTKLVKPLQDLFNIKLKAIASDYIPPTKLEIFLVKSAPHSNNNILTVANFITDTFSQLVDEAIEQSVEPTSDIQNKSFYHLDQYQSISYNDICSSKNFV